MKYKNFIKSVLHVISLVCLISSVSLAENRKCDSDLITYIYQNGSKNFNYNEIRNDAGIFFDFDWNKEQ